MSPQAVRVSNSSQVNSTGAQPGTQSQTDSTISQAVYNSSQQGMNAGSTGTQS